MTSRVCVLILLAGSVSILMAQNGNPVDRKPRVFITDSQSWEMSGGGGGTSEGFGGTSHGGARPQTAEIIKTFGERCPQVTINNNKDKADYIVLLDHEGGKSLILHDNKVAVFNKDGDSIISHSTVQLGSAVKDACDAIVKDWPRQAAQLRTQAAPSTDPATPGQTPETKGVGKISVSSTPANADIEVDGTFVGNTPSMVELTQGDHEIAIKKSGYQTWQRKMKIVSGSINVVAELEKAQ